MTATDGDTLKLGSMGQAVPIRRLATEIEGQSADAVVGEIIVQQNSHFRRWVDFAGA
jgi:hypothetical protein